MRPSTPPQRPRVAFSFIDLCVSAVIIVILVLLFSPALAAAREVARKASCTTHLRQVGLAVQMYAADSDDTLPPGEYTPPGRPHITWYDLLEPYTRREAHPKGTPLPLAERRRQTSIYICPSFHDPEIPVLPGDRGPFRFPVGQLDPAMSYAANGNLMPVIEEGSSRDTYPGKITPLSSLRSASQVVLAAHARGVRPTIAGDDTTSGCMGDEEGYPATGNRAIGNASVYCAGRYFHGHGSL